MFSPTKVWRKWHIRISTSQRRYATVSALAGSSVYPLVLARGHRVEKLPEVPLVVSDAEFEGLAKTKDAVKLLKNLGAYEDVERVVATKHVRAGKGKARGKRYTQKKGPLIVHNKEAEGSRKVATLVSAFRNIPGVELCHVSRLNLLQLAPGGRVGRFIVWTEGAFRQLDQIFGTYKADSKQKVGFRPPHAIMTNADLGRIINSSEIQSAIRPKKAQPRRAPVKKNPLKNVQALQRLNPAAHQQRRAALAASKPKSGKVQKPKVVREKEIAKYKKRQAKLKQFHKVLSTPAVAPLRSELEKGTQL